MNFSSLDYYLSQYIKPAILLLLFLVLCYAGYHQTEYYETMSSNVMSEIPIYCVDTGDKSQISVTFDSAWGTEDLEEILAILKKHKCVAAFFVTGDWAEEHPEAIRAISQDGHIIGNHGHHHKHMTQLDAQGMSDEIMGCHNIIKQQTGNDMMFFRAPYGDYNEAVVEAAKKCGYYTIQWDVDSLDWKDYGVDAIVHTVCDHKHLGPGSILLLHNGSKYTKDALDTLLLNLESQGYQFVPLDQLIWQGDYGIDHEGRMHGK